MTAPERRMRQWEGRTWKLQKRSARGNWETVSPYDSAQQAKLVLRAIEPERGCEYRVIAPDGEAIMRRKCA